MKNVLALAAVFCLTALVALGQGPGAKKDDKAGDKTGKGIEGRFKIVKAFKDGKQEPDKEVKDVMVVITKNTIISTGKDKKQVYGATYTLDTSKEPWQISMVGTAPKKGEKAEGIVKRDGDKLHVCYALPGGKVPTTFEAGEKQHCIILERVKE